MCSEAASKELMIRTLTLISYAGLLVGCANTSVYEEAAKEIVAESNHLVHYVASWSPLDEAQGGAPVREQDQAFMSVLDYCAETLEAQKHDLMGRRHPGIAIATIQLLDCLSESNWKIKIVEEIILVE